MSGKKLCKSCSGPLEDSNQEDIVNPDFCPYCVDEKGKLRGYKEILEGMIEYIQSDHPEVQKEDQYKQAVEWLEEGPIWGELWTGTVINESLENKLFSDKQKQILIEKFRDIIRIVSARTSEVEDPEKNHGFINWHIYEIEFTRAQLDMIVDFFKKNLRKGPWWCDFACKDMVCIVFRNKAFHGEKFDKDFKTEVNTYAKMVRCPEDQLPIN
jgi:hypothetical protein